MYMYACEHAFMISNIYVFMTMKNLVCRTEMADNPVDVQVFLHVHVCIIHMPQWPITTTHIFTTYCKDKLSVNHVLVFIILNSYVVLHVDFGQTTRQNFNLSMT